MAMIKCSECGKAISDKATLCIHCGCPVDTINSAKSTCTENNTQPLKDSLFGWIFIISVVALIVFLTSMCNSEGYDSNDGLCDICDKRPVTKLYDEEFCGTHLTGAIKHYLK